MSTGSITVNPDTPESYSLQIDEGEVLEIGRKPAAGGKKKLILPYPEVSGQHAEIRCKSSGWTIVDSGSTNGTSLNNSRLTPGREYVLHVGDIVQIAHYLLKVSPPLIPVVAEEQDLDEAQDKTQFRIHLIHATILVGDIKGFTTLMEQYAEQPDFVMQSAKRIFDMMSEQIDKHYGKLEKIAGDAIMAYWHGDDSKVGQQMQAHYACTSALHLKKLAENLAVDKEIWPFSNHPLKVDMALATGPVAAGALGQTGNPNLLGDTANLVFRLEKLIDDNHSGEIVVEGFTYELAKEHFKFQSLGQFNVKGRQRPVDVYRLINALE